MQTSIQTQGFTQTHIHKYIHTHICCCYCSVTQSCLTLCDPVDFGSRGFPVHHHLPCPSPSHHHPHIHTQTHIYIYTHTLSHTHAYAHGCTHVHAHIYTRTHVHIRVHAGTHACACTHRHASSWAGTGELLQRKGVLSHDSSVPPRSVKLLSTMQEIRVRSLDQEDLLEKERQSTQILLSEKSLGQRSLVGYSPWGRKELDTTERLQSNQIKSRNGNVSLYNRDCRALFFLIRSTSGARGGVGA